MNQSIAYLFAATATLLAMLSAPVFSSSGAMPMDKISEKLEHLRQKRPPRYVYAPPPPAAMAGYGQATVGVPQYNPYYISHYYPTTPGADALTVPAAAPAAPAAAAAPAPAPQAQPEPASAPAQEAAPAQTEQPAQPQHPGVAHRILRQRNRKLSPRLSAAMATAGGAAASAAVYQGQPGGHVTSASAGTFAANGAGHESASYARDTESLQRHEHGREDDDHYFQSQAESKSSEKNTHEAFNNEDEDVMQDGNMFRKKKSKTNYVKQSNKIKNTNGTGVLAKDQRHASYNKDRHHMTDNISQHQMRDSNGAMAQYGSVTSSNFDDEDEAYYNSDGMHPAPQFGHYYPGASAYSNGRMSMAHAAVPIAAQAGK